MSLPDATRIVLTLGLLLAKTPATASANDLVSPDPTWDLSQIFSSDADWEAERQHFEAQLENVRDALQAWTETPEAMLAYLELDCAMEQSFFRLIYYADLQLASHQDKPEYHRMRGVMFGLLGQWQSITSNVDSDLVELGTDGFAAFRQSEPGLEEYAHQVTSRLRAGNEALSPEVERLLALSRPLIYQPKTVRDALYYSDLPRVEVTPPDLVNTFAALMNNEIQSQHYFAQAHGSATALEYRFSSENLDPAIFHRAVDSSREHLPLFQRYLDLKKDLIGKDQIDLDDLFDPVEVANERDYSYAEAAAAVRKSLAILGPEYSEGLRQAFQDRWIDVFPSATKRGAGGVTQVYGLHPYILLNFTGSYRDVNVLAHELGHAIQFWLIDHHHPCVNSSTSSFLVEIAAHFNEQLLIDHLLAQESDPAVRIFLLERQLDSMVAALFGQARISELEHRMHLRVENGDTLTGPWINGQYLQLMREYYGHDKDLVRVPPTAGTRWIDIDYLYKSYYAINYTIGMVAALAFKDRIEHEGHIAVERYLDFLKTGGTDDPLVLLRRAGVDMRSPETYDAAYSQLEELVDELHRAAAQGGSTDRTSSPCASTEADGL